MADPIIVKMEDITPVDRGAGAKTYPLIGSGAGAELLSVGVSAFEPGVAVPMHAHNVEEVVVVLEGAGECIVDGVSHPVKASDTTFIPSGRDHCFRNTGSSTMRILWIYGSTQVTRTFTETGVTVPHLSEADRIGGQ
jgi:mannose-6-phosphate isomerase-like protein (cupin superfamily)